MTRPEKQPGDFTEMISATQNAKVPKEADGHYDR
jgi:hypothetical protein